MPCSRLCDVARRVGARHYGGLVSTPLNLARAMGEDLVALRRDLHRHPEIGLHLPRTQQRVLRIGAKPAACQRGFAVRLSIDQTRPAGKRP